MAEKIVLCIFLIPIYGVLIWSFVDPWGSYMWGKRWMFDDEPEPTDAYIRFIKISSVILMVMITVMMIFVFLR